MKINKLFWANVLSKILGPPNLMIFFLVWPHFTSNLIPFWLLFVLIILDWFIPVIVFTYLLKIGKISNLDASKREERVFFYIITFVLWTIGFFLLSATHSSDYLTFYLPVYFLNGILVAITLFYKVSIHAAYNTMFLLFILYYFGLFFALLYLPILLLVCWSRVYIHNHSIKQLLLGSIIAFLVWTWWWMIFMLPRFIITGT